MRKRAAFTLTEIITVVSIVAVLAALAFPVFAAVKRRSHEAQSTQNMRQIWTALSIYRQEYEGLPAGSPGDGIASLGLPRGGLLGLVRAEKLPDSIHIAGGESQWPGQGPVYTWLIPDGPEEAAIKPVWTAYVMREGEGAVFMLDGTFNEMYSVFHPLRTHHVIGAFLDGHVKARDGAGDYATYEFWTNDRH